MAALGSSVMTLVDHAKRFGPDGKVADIAELLNQNNEAMEDILWREGNLPTGHRITTRVGLPTVYWRLINKGTPNSKSRTAQVDESIGMLVGRSQLDEDLAELEGDVNGTRMSEAEPFVEAMSQEFCQTLFYGSGANPEEFVGLSNRYGDLSAANAQNIIDCGGTGSNNTSIWLIGWGQNSAFCVYPKGSQAGLQHVDIGIDDALDSDGNPFRAYKDQWKMKGGLALKDWRYAVRMCNIDISALIADGAGSTVKLQEYMLKAIHRLPRTNGKTMKDGSYSGVKACFYANRTVKEMLDIQAMNKSNLFLSAGNEEGKQKLSLRGIPIKTLDQLIEAEARVT